MVQLRGGKQPTDRVRRRSDFSPKQYQFLVLLVICFLAASNRAFAFSCSMTATAVAFGSVDVTTGSAVNSTGTLTLNCSGGPGGKYLLICVSIDGGSAHDGTSRLMNGPGAAQLRYQLYSDSARTVPWGSWPLSLYGGGYSWTPFSTTSNGTWMATVYGSALGSQQTITPGAYTSNLNVYFTYDDHSFANGGSDSGFICPDGSNKGNSTTSFQATATVPSACTVGATNLNFGSVGTLASNVDSTSSISVLCSNTTPYNIGLNAGNGTGATVSNRMMTLSGATVNYALYSNSGRTSNWGNTVGTDTVGGTGSGSTQTLTVYGRVPVQSTPASGTYGDIIVVTVTY